MPFPVQPSTNPEYLAEKANGTRLPNGALRLKKLTPKHETILTLHMRGVPGGVIAERMGMSQVSISRILNDPLTLAHARLRIDAQDDRFLNLKEKVVDAIEDALSFDQDIDTRLAAADKWFKAHGYYEKKGGPGANISLEDVVAKLIENGGGNVNVNVAPAPAQAEPVVIENPSQER